MTHPGRLRGFTLIELLVVLVIIGIVASIAVISLGSLGGDPPAQQTAGKLAELTELAAEQAVMQGREYGLRVEPHAYAFLTYDGRTWNEPKDDSLFARHELEDVTLSLDLEGTPVTLAPAPSTASAPSVVTGNSDAAAKPQVLLLSSGELTPFIIRVTGTDKKSVYIVKGTLVDGVKLLAPGETDSH
ncbi:MAG TPA: type II secretion system minor pseudopilin GspH [Gammaproteobacteria bacterium]|nr:type II secretion system minor pseudopilin GspH [Gammaproteobacteria bacterium]